MKPKLHKDLTQARWNKLSFFAQMANIGSEFERAVNWQKKSPKIAGQAVDRMFELLDLTINDPKNRRGLKEIVRLREVLADLLVFDNEYHSDINKTKKYFYAFNWAARI